MRSLMITLLLFSVACSKQNNSVNQQGEEVSVRSFDISPLQLGSLNISVEDESVDFGQTTTSLKEKEVSIDLRNDSTSPVNFTIDSSLMNGFSIKVNRCVSPLAAKKSCKLTLAFKARGLYDGQKSSSLLIESGANSLTLNLSGEVTGQPDPNITGTPSLVVTMGSPFSEAGLAYREIRIRNSGSGSAKSLDFTLADEYALRLNRCPSDLAPGAECYIQVVYKNSRSSTPAPSGIVVFAASSPSNVEIRESVDLIDGEAAPYTPVYVATYGSLPSNPVPNACDGSQTIQDPPLSCREQAFNRVVSNSLCVNRSTSFQSPAGPAPSQSISNGQRNYFCNAGSQDQIFVSGQCNSGFVYYPSSVSGACVTEMVITAGTCDNAFEGENCQPARTGGMAPFTYQINNTSGGASINASTGILSPDGRNGSTTVTVSDSSGQVKNVTISNIRAVYRTCKELLENVPAEAGQFKTYWVDPDGLRTGSSKLSLTCDMSTDGGGWTLVFSSIGNFNYITTSNQFQFYSQSVVDQSTFMMTYYANSSEVAVSTKYKFIKPSGFNPWTVDAGIANTTLTNLSTGVTGVNALIYGYRSFSTLPCHDWVTNSNYGRFTVCRNGTNPSAFDNFPFYTGYSNADSDYCAYANSSSFSALGVCGSSRYLVLWAR